MKKIIVLVCFCFLSAGAAAGPAEPTPAAYENYLIIKYLLYLYDFDQAGARIDRFLETHPEDPFLLTEKAWLLYKVKNDPQEALKLLEKAKTVYPRYYYSNYLHAAVLLSRYIRPDKGPDADPGKDKNKPGDPGGKMAEALKYLALSIADNPDFYDGHFLKGVILGEQGRYKESNLAFEQAGRLEEHPEAYDYMANNYHRLKDNDGEIKAYRKILELSPSDYRAQQALAQIYLETENYKNAALLLEKLVSRNPGDKRLSVKYLYSLFAAGNTGKFLELSDNMDLSGSPLLLYARALVLSRQDKLDEAQQLLEKANINDPGCGILLAEICLRKQDYYRAYRLLEKIGTPPGNPLYYPVQLNTLALLDMNRRVIDFFTRIRDDKGALAYLGENDYYTVLYAYANLGRTDRVRETARFAADRLKEESGNLTRLVRILRDFSAGKPMAASGRGRKTEFDRNTYLILTLYRKQHRYDHAVALLREMCKQANEPDPWLELCDVYRKQGRPGKVEPILKKLRKRFPGSAPVKNFYAYFLALQNKNLEHALQLSSGTLTAGKGAPGFAYLDTYGYILLRLGRTPEAMAYLEKAYEKNPFDPEIMEHLADCYRAKKEYPRVIEIYRKAIDNGVDFTDELAEKIRELEKEK